MTNRIRALDGVVSTESFLYLELWKQLYDWGARVENGDAGAGRLMAVERSGLEESPSGRRVGADVRLDARDEAASTTSSAVDDLSLEIERGSFFALLGPSGCGKTTTLRMIGGFEEPTDGTIYLGDATVTGMPPYKRDVNTVFQSYALFPHLTHLRERRLRPAPPRACAASDVAAQVARDARARRASRATRSASRGSSPAASSSASRSRGRSSTSRACSCSTSRSARST